MKKIIFITIGIICALSVSAQITKQNQSFDKISTIDGKVFFIKEIALNTSSDNAFNILKEWGKENYGKEPFISSVRYNNEKQEILAKSRIELLLPENTHRVREKMTMRYRIDGFIVDNKCVLQISDLSYLLENTKNKSLPRIIKAEDFITDSHLQTNDDLQELRINTRKSTLYFLNTLTSDFEKLLGY